MMFKFAPFIACLWFGMSTLASSISYAGEDDDEDDEAETEAVVAAPANPPKAHAGWRLAKQYPPLTRADNTI